MSKFLKLFLLTTAVAAVVGCVSPFYGTARIEPGWHMDVGMAATSFVGATEWFPYCIGIRGDAELSYGFNKYLGVNGRTALGLGYVLSEGGPMSLMPILDGALGFQAALPLKTVTPALKVELSYYAEPALSSAFLVGLGQDERATIGCRAYIEEFSDLAALDIFIGIHPVPKWTFFGGIETMTLFNKPFYPIVTIGLGYNLLNQRRGDKKFGD
ncbi:hypothetical protein GF359_06705 [candidate division WOR-3 bacterium]|uniref:Uncharacterized protein n=1 Tax=candidate division WOR-3 bacterium TaxID=2052148 RepID=A0A9D5QCP1_UNCW3|nr:hypothetical protein [candidate division WOR-3 bacterium]MBD3364888.1 hypothetical protein [candidate division WOR-3 bacterium]